MKLLIPGKLGWQVWKGASDAAFTLESDQGHQLASDIEKLPKTGLLMAFPVRRVTALPFRTPTTELDLRRDLAEMHAEQMGFRAEPGAGDLFDVFTVNASDEGAVLLPVVLAPPEPGTLPLRTPGQFDISPRFYDIPAHTVAMWEEFGRWVFAFPSSSGSGEILYFQGLTEGLLNDAAGTELQLALAQLQLQGCDPQIERVIVWHDPEERDFLIPESFASSLSTPVEALPKPAPRMPRKISALLPDDVVAARYEKARARNARLGVAALLLALLGVAGWGGYKVWEVEKTVRQTQAKLDALGPEAVALQAHQERWTELEDLVNQDAYPVELAFKVIQSVPPKARRSGTLRFNEIKIEGNKVITIQGNGELDSVNQFNLQLKRNAGFADYVWETPSATQETNTGKWRFQYTGVPESLQVVGQN